MNKDLNTPAMYLEQEYFLMPFFIILRPFTTARNILYFTSCRHAKFSPLLLASGVIEELILSVVISVGEKNIYRKTWFFEGGLKVENS